MTASIFKQYLLIFSALFSLHALAKPQTYTDGFEKGKTSGRILLSFAGGKGIRSKTLSFTKAQKFKGRRSLKCEYGFSEKGWIIYSLKHALPGNVSPRDFQRGDEVSFYIKGKLTGVYVNLQLVDNKGEYFQRNFTLKEDKWVQRKLLLEEDKFPNRWSGDGKLDFPLKEINLTVNMDHGGNGVFFLDELSVSGGKLVPREMPVDRTSLAEKLKDLKIYQAPLTDKKHIIAHNMTEIYAEKEPAHAFCVREFFNVNGSTKSLGGYLQYLPYIDYREGSPAGVKSLEEAAETELKAAMVCGLTGFQFYYPYGHPDMMDYYNKRIVTLMNKANELKLDFTFTLCFANANHNETEAQKISLWAKKVKHIFENTPPEYWLKTPDGRHIFFTWMAEGLADEIDNAWSITQNAALVKFAALAYDNLAKALGVKAAWNFMVLNLNNDTDPDFTSELISYFPAVWGWAQLDYRYYDKNIWDDFARQTRERGRAYTQSAALDFYTSKSYDKNEAWSLIFDIEKALKLGVEGQFRHYMELELTKAFRQSLDRAAKQGPGIINIVTWNDFAEGHHLSPDANHNFAFAMILNYYRQLWQDPSYVPEVEKAAVFFKKYRSDLKPKYDYELHTEGLEPVSASDFIEAVTILKSTAEVRINGKPAGKVKAGIDAVRIPTETGPVKVEVIRAGKVVLSLKATEAITGKPYRTDRHTYGYSTIEETYVKKIFDDDRSTILPSREYAK